MSSISIFPFKKMWPGNRRPTEGADFDDSSKLLPEVPGKRGSSVRKTNPWMVEPVYPTLLTQQDIGSLPFGWNSASRTGVTNGDNIGAISGRGIDGGPRFNQPVTPGGYLWWYIDGTSENLSLIHI